MLLSYVNRDSIKRDLKHREYVEIQKRFNEKISIAKSLVDSFNRALSQSVNDSSSRKIEVDAQRFSNRGIYIYLYHNGIPVSWNSNIPGPDEFKTDYNHENIVENLSGGTYYVSTSDSLDWCIIVAIKIYDNYPIHNQFLKSRLYPANFAFNGISLNSESPFGIYDGFTYIYSLQPNENLLNSTFPILLLIGLFLIGYGVTLLISLRRWKKLEWLKVLFVISIAVATLFTLNRYNTLLNTALPSWMHTDSANHAFRMLQWLLLILFIFPTVLSCISARQLSKLPRIFKGIALPLLFTAGATFLSGLAILTAETFIDILGPIGAAKTIFTGPAIFGLICLITLGILIFLLLKRGLQIAIFSQTPRIWLATIVTVNTLIATFLPFESINDRNIAMAGVFFTGTIWALSVIRPSFTKHFPLLLALITSTILSFQFLNTNQENVERYLGHIAKELAKDHDPVAENLLLQLNDQLSADTSIAAMLKKVPVSLPLLHQYLVENYYKGYLSQYDIQITACPHGTKLLVNDISKHVGCKDFFMDMALSHGIPILKDHIYYLNNNNGRISYLLLYTYAGGRTGENFLSIEIDSKLAIDLPGYPSLLIDNVQQHPREEIPANISYAKYYGGNLETKSGNFLYPLKLPGNLSDTGVIMLNNSIHYAYKPSSNRHIIVTQQTYSLLFLLSPFVYIFLATYPLAVFVFRRRKVINRKHTLQQRIRSYSVLLMVISMLSVGAVSVGYELSRQKVNVNESISEKLRSAIVSIEPQIQLLSSSGTIKAGELDSVLFTLSNVIYADINIFHTTGELCGTSRHEAFTNELQGFWLSPEAYQAIVVEKKELFLAKEYIGTLSFTSAYAPVLSRNGQVLAIINLPYFTRESEIREQTISLIGRIANIYLLLSILAGISGFFAANTISKPLQRLKAAMRRTNITGSPELISYKENDEIGQLVNEYNRMVTELSKNAQLLAQSEKEKVWREMARQIAHEIKNPLTPIKLSLQQLIKLKNGGAPEWDKKFDEFSNMLLEQVDILAQTASQFSSVASDTRSNASNINLFELLSNTKALFAGQAGLTMDIHSLEQKNMLVYADHEQLQKAITNLIKNAIQATHHTKIPKITVAVECTEAEILLIITDNGEGISPAHQARIFEPYFTTKSGGTGLGLVLTRKTIEESGGSIWFTSKIGMGTTFYCNLPLVKEDSRL